MATAITSKGQVTIPKHLRDAAGFAVGVRVDFDVNEQGQIFLRPEKAPAETVQERIERALAALEIDNPWSGTTDEYMALMRGDD